MLCSGGWEGYGEIIRIVYGGGLDSPTCARATLEFLLVERERLFGVPSFRRLVRALYFRRDYTTLFSRGGGAVLLMLVVVVVVVAVWILEVPLSAFACNIEVARARFE